MIGIDDPMKEEDLHMYNTRKWLFQFLSDGEAFAKTYVCVCKAKTAIKNYPLSHFIGGEKEHKIIVLISHVRKTNYFSCFYCLSLIV